MNEEWRDIEGYEGLYQVSNLGRVKSLNYNHTKSEKILKSSIEGRGYKTVTLYKNGIQKTYKIHKLVAQHFIPNPDNLMCINHKDENKLNNNVENLEWCTTRYNNIYGTRIKRAAKSKSKKVKCITTNEKFNSIKEASEKYNIYNGDIVNCCKKKRKSAGKHPITGEKLKWEYLKEV